MVEDVVVECLQLYSDILMCQLAEIRKLRLLGPLLSLAHIKKDFCIALQNSDLISLRHILKETLK